MEHRFLWLLICSFLLPLITGFVVPGFRDISSEEDAIDRLSHRTAEQRADILARETAELPVELYKPPEKEEERQRYHKKRVSSPNKQVKISEDQSNDIYFLVTVTACSVAAVIGIIGAGVCWYRFQKNAKAAAEAEYPAYGVTGPTPTVKNGDGKLAQYAHMYHYQHQKQQMIAMETQGAEERNIHSDIESEEENGETDDTVYECPGLAPTGELEVKNPLFQDEQAPAKTN